MNRRICPKCQKIIILPQQNTTNSRLLALGLKRHATPSDGNCLFHAVSFLLKSKQITDTPPDTLRKNVCEFIDNNLDLFREDLEREYGSVEKFQQVMRKKGTYGCCIVLNAFSILFNVNFYVHFPTNVFQTNPSTLGAADRVALHIIFTRDPQYLNGHWESTERL